MYGTVQREFEWDRLDGLQYQKFGFGRPDIEGSVQKYMSSGGAIVTEKNGERYTRIV